MYTSMHILINDILKKQEDILEDKRHNNCFIRHEILGISCEYWGEQRKSFRVSPRPNWEIP